MMNTPNNESKKEYETPLIAEHASMTFPQEIWEEFVGSAEVFQCYHCNCKG
jgi:hypothetical protein